MRSRTLWLVAMVALVVASCGGSNPESTGQPEGIAVHGDWTIDVYNEDGSLDQHVEFSNALTPIGEAVIAAHLTSALTAGVWTVLLGGNDPICLDGTVPFLCALTETGATLTGFSYAFEGLSVEVNASSAIVLSGSVQAQRDGSVGLVTTQLGACPSTVAPDDCHSNGGAGSPIQVTQTANPVVTVADGQQVQIEVEISFTTG